MNNSYIIIIDEADGGDTIIHDIIGRDEADREYNRALGRDDALHVQLNYIDSYGEEEEVKSFNII